VEGEYNITRGAYDGIVSVYNKEDVGDGDKVFGSPDKLDFHIAVWVDVELLRV
jgi:hypothetical protein